MGKLTRSLGSRQLLARLLEQPGLVAAVQGMQPRMLARLIDRVGIEDSGELIALATTRQLEGIFDEDLWRSSRPGTAEEFDADRFGLWLEVMLEMGSAQLAERLAEMDEDFLTLALSMQVFVLDSGELALDTMEEKALASSLCQEFDLNWVISRRAESWDAVITALLALDLEHHDLVVRVLERLSYLSSEYIEDNGGLYEVLTGEEQLGEDVAHEREKRRGREGFVAPDVAAAFLKLARGPLETEDHLTPAYFRDFQPAQGPQQGPMTASSAIDELLKDESLLPEPGRATPLGESLARLRVRDPALHAQRMAELSYLSNVLVAGCSFQGRVFRPGEAADAVLAACNLGMELIGDGDPIRLFRAGWREWFNEIVLPASNAFIQLCEELANGSADPWMGKQLRALARVREPWKVPDQVDLLEVVHDPLILRQLKALLCECPMFEGRWVSTVADLRSAGGWSESAIGLRYEE